MAPPKSRGHLLVNLATRNSSEEEPNLITVPRASQNHEKMIPGEVTVESPTEMLAETPENISLPTNDLSYSVEFENSRCSGLFSDIPAEYERQSISPWIELINSQSTLPETGDVLIHPEAPIANAIEELFNSTEEIEVNVIQSEAELGAGDQGIVDRESQITSATPREEIINPMTPAVNTLAEKPDSIGEAEDNPMPSTSASVTENHHSSVDPDYIPESSENNNLAQEGRPKRGRKRKYPDQNRVTRKKKSNNNENYISASGKEVTAKQFQGTEYDCKCPLKCTIKLTSEQRKNEFNKFWSCGSYEARCAILQGSVIEKKTQRSYSVNSKRLFTRKYTLANTPLCKKAFLNTLGISQSRIDCALNKFRSQAPLSDKRGVNSGGKNAISQEQLSQLKQFIDSLPKYTSHYCRDMTTSMYLAPNLNLTLMYELYKEKKYQNPVSFSRFRDCFYKNFNLRFKKPQKDTCFRCDRYKASKTGVNGEQLQSLQEEHNNHLDIASKLRRQMNEDLANAKIDVTLETLTFDLEKTHCLPRLPTSIVYYKRQLNLYNLGIHCGSTGLGFFYIWLEQEAGRGTQEVGSSLRKYIKDHLKQGTTHLILWSDSCGGQNRSIKMILMLLHILHHHETLQVITIRFLQPGHTYLPNDSEFGDVERALKSQIRLYTPEDYMAVMENCRRNKKFTITRLQADDFRSVAPMQNRITNRKTDINKQKISWLTTSEIEIRRNEPSKLFMKSKLEDEPRVVDIAKGRKNTTTSRNFDVELPILYPNGRKLSAPKVKDLKEMVKLIPADARPFYNFLRDIETEDFIDDAEGFGNEIDFELEDYDRDDI